MTITGTNTGPGRIPPTGSWIKYSSVSIIRIVNGKIDEQLIYANYAAVLRQLGYTFTPP
jgi:predicted ester cyclase